MPHILVDLLSYTGTKGGMETYTRELYRHIGQLDHEFTFTGMTSREGMRCDLSWFPGRLFDSGISGENRFYWAYGELFAVSRAARQRQVDLVHCPATLGPRRTTCPTVVTMHDMMYWSHPEFMTTPFYTKPVMWMETQAAHNATHIITISDVSKSEILKYLGLPDSKVSVIAEAGTSGIVAPATVERQSDMILATGNRRPHKNFVSLIRALSLIEPERRPHLVITGSRGDDPLRSVVEELSLGQWVELKAWVSDEELALLHQTATALAIPAFQEGFGLPVLDAMLADLPVIVSDLPIFHEVAGEAALYFSPWDLQSIADAMVRITTEPGLVQALVEAGRSRAALFSWRATAAQTMDIFRSVLRR